MSKFKGASGCGWIVVNEAEDYWVTNRYSNVGTPFIGTKSEAMSEAGTGESIQRVRWKFEPYRKVKTKRKTKKGQTA